MVHESLLTATAYASGSHPRRVFSPDYLLTGFFTPVTEWLATELDELRQVLVWYTRGPSQSGNFGTTRYN